MMHQRMNKNGFTLIETTVAMLVMMVVGLSATSLFLYSVRYNSGASLRSTAMAVAQQRLETLRGADFSDARLAFGTHTPQTVVISPITSTTYMQGASVGGDESYEAAATASSYSNAFAAAAAATPTPTPTPTGGTPANSTSYRIQTQVDPYPTGVSAAAATQKQITIRVTPINGNGNSSWVNQNTVEVIFRRSMNVSGPYRQ
jgi:type II secretory pathway pseudopilin PulG